MGDRFKRDSKAQPIDKFTMEPIVTTSNSQCQSLLPTKY